MIFEEDNEKFWFKDLNLSNDEMRDVLEFLDKFVVCNGLIEAIFKFKPYIDNDGKMIFELGDEVIDYIEMSTFNMRPFCRYCDEEVRSENLLEHILNHIKNDDWRNYNEL